jgi:hypothetical protein
MIAAMILNLAGGQLAGQTPSPDGPPGGEPPRVVVNSQKSLAEVVGEGFRDEAWDYPAELIPREFPGLAYVSGPADRGTEPKAVWRKPVILRDGTGVSIAVNCYRAREKQPKGPGSGSPFAPLLEPDYEYSKTEFHKLRAATASNEGRDVFAFRNGDHLFKIEATGGKPDARQKAKEAAADAIYRHLQLE